MTKDMAIEILQRELADYEPEHALAQALRMAIEAMEHEPAADELRDENNKLKLRCYALTKGVMCSFCNYECDIGLKK